MDLRAWIESHPEGERSAAVRRLAETLKRSEPAIRHWINGTRQVPATKVKALVLATGGAVKAKDVRPDVFAEHTA